MAVTVLETLDVEDLKRWREAACLIDVMQAEGLAIPTENEAMFSQFKRAFFDFYVLTDELLKKYGIEGEEADEAKISPQTGHIYIGAEE